MSVQAAALVLLVDRSDVLGAARPNGERHVPATRDALLAAVPRAPAFVVRTATDTGPRARAPRPLPGRARDVVSAFHTDVRRLADIHAHRFAHVLVVRPTAAPPPAAALRHALAEAQRRRADLVAFDDGGEDECYVVSAGLLQRLLAVGAIPGALTVPRALARLAAVNPGAPMPWTVVRLPRPAAWPRPHGAIESHTATSDSSTPSAPRPVVVALPSPYQTGAHFAWMALLDHLDPAQVGFVVARETLLADALAARGFATMMVGPRWLAPQTFDEQAWKQALDLWQPSVLHADGAECGPLLAVARRRGARTLLHVRLTIVDRFLPACAHADAVVAVSSSVRGALAARLPAGPPVRHVPDGVAPTGVTPRGAIPSARPLRLVCLGRVEPAKDQLRVIEIAQALAAHRPCALRLVGPCGNDVAYADEVTTRLRAAADTFRSRWYPFSHPARAHYEWADVVLVGSRNEALGMVGLEALAAGRLLIASRSSGYAEIVDETAGEGVLFDRDEPAVRIAGRLHGALTSYAEYVAAGRRKVLAQFAAGQCAARLTDLWSEQP